MMGDELYYVRQMSPVSHPKSLVPQIFFLRSRWPGVHGDCDAAARDLARESPKCRAARGAVFGASRLEAGEHLPILQNKCQAFA